VTTEPIVCQCQFPQRIVVIQR